MKNHRNLVVLCLAALLAGLNGLEADTTLVSYNFDSLSTGALAGQDNWAVTSGAISPLISANNATSSYSDLTNVADRSSAATGTPLVRNSSLFSAGSLNSSGLLTLSMNVYVGGAGSTSFFGIGGPSYAGGGGMSASFGILNGLLSVRQEGNATANGTVFNAKTSSNGTISLATGWYTLQSVWDLSTGTATLAYKNLTVGDTSFTTVYFDAAQTQTTESLVNGTFNPATWNSVYLRTGITATGSGVGFVDNLSVLVSPVPEPATVALAVLALLLGAASWQRKRAFAR